MKENREVWMFSFINGRGVFQETKFDADADKVTEFYRENGYIRANVGVPEQKFISDSDGREDALDRAAHPDHRRPPIQGRRGRVHGQHDHQDRVPEAALQAEHRRLLQREERPQGHGEGARGVRRRRLLGVHGLPRLQVPRRPESGGGAGAPGARRAGRAGPRDRGRHDAPAGRAAGTSSTASRSSATRRRTTP